MSETELKKWQRYAGLINAKRMWFLRYTEAIKQRDQANAELIMLRRELEQARELLSGWQESFIEVPPTDEVIREVNDWLRKHPAKGAETS